MRSGDLVASRNSVLAGLSEKADNLRLMALLVSVEIRADELTEAQRVLDKLKELEPGSVGVAILTGDIAYARENFVSANKEYQIAWSIDPVDQVALKIFGALSRQPENDRKTMAFLEEWVEKLPQSQAYGLTRASFYMQKGEMDVAKRQYEAMVEESENLAIAYNNLAWIYGENELDKALEVGKKAYELAPQSAEIIDTYAWFLFKKGDLQRARDLLIQAVDMASDNEEIRQHLEAVLSEI
jgi:Tfp pilus assembly protein PilF